MPRSTLTGRLDIAVVGAGPAGCAAAVQCARLGVRPTLFDRRGEAGGLIGNARSIENYPGLEAEIDGSTFVTRLRAMLERHGLTVQHAAIDRVVLGDQELHLRTTTGSHSCRTVIVAVGTDPVRPTWAKEGGNSRVHFEVRDLLTLQPEARQVVVVGAGEAGCDYALHLARRGVDVRMLVRGDQLTARGRLAENVRTQPGIALEFSTEVVEVSGPERGPLRLTVRRGDRREELNADGVVIAVGRSSAATGLLAGIDWKPGDRAVAAPPEASPPGLFVVGDARHGALGQLGMAVGDGLRAAAAAVALVTGSDW